jgi:hypothetical protein
MSERDWVLKRAMVESFLAARGWERSVERPHLTQFRAPRELWAESEFYVSVPVDDSDEEAQTSLQRIVSTLARIYGTNVDQLAAVLAGAPTVLAVQFDDPQTVKGSIPFLRLERFFEHTKSALLDTATFVLTNLPMNGPHSEDAYTFIRRCRALQTDRGSYVAKIEMPGDELLTFGTLLSQEPLPSSAVSERFADVLKFVTTEVFAWTPEIRTEEFWLESTQLLNVDLTGC